ncbi:MAG: glycosyltransferase family 4 protein [Acidobacteriaceae bacterium]|nr:glycosyltransferase family 4 protein [Acidobacteriaceae bacterium]
MSADVPEPTGRSFRILMTADAAGGVWQYSVDLIRGLAEHNARVLLATMGPRPSVDQKKQLLSIPHVALAGSDYALEWMPNPWPDVEAAGSWLLELARDFEADVVHLNGYAHGNLPWRRPVVITAHSCVYSWWKAVHGGPPGEQWLEYKRRVLEGLAASDIVIAPSRTMAQSIEQEYGVDHRRLQVIHNFSGGTRRNSAGKENYILAAGRVWDQAKNLSLLDRIAPDLQWEMRIAGSDRVPHDSIASSKSAHFLGALPHAALLKQMQRASVFVHPALYEPFGLAVLEAARCRCCLVLSDVSSLRELWEGAAVFVDPRRPDDWIRELNRLIADPVERHRMAALAFAHASKYRAGSSLKQYLRVYAALLDRKRQRTKEAAA